MKKQYWKDKAVLITGASSGLGYALVEALAQFQVHLGLISRREEPMKELASKLSTSGSRFWMRSCDVTKRNEVECAVDDFEQEAGKLDVVWVNSGVTGDTSQPVWNWNTVEQIVDTNLKGAIYTTQASLRHMIPQKSGVIVAISSAAAMRGLPARGIYSASKVALAYYLESLACEQPEIQFTTIYPGFVDTPINRNNPKRFWLMTPHRAAILMIRAVEKGKAEYIYPFRMALLFRLVRLIPASIFRRIARRLIEVSRPG